DEQQDHDADADRQRDHVRLPPRCPSAAGVAGASVGSTLSFNPSIWTTRTWSPLRGVPRTASAVQCSDATWTTPVGGRAYRTAPSSPSNCPSRLGAVGCRSRIAARTTIRKKTAAKAATGTITSGETD